MNQKNVLLKPILCLSSLSSLPRSGFVRKQNPGVKAPGARRGCTALQNYRGRVRSLDNAFLHEHSILPPQHSVNPIRIPKLYSSITIQPIPALSTNIVRFAFHALCAAEKCPNQIYQPSWASKASISKSRYDRRPRLSINTSPLIYLYKISSTATCYINHPPRMVPKQCSLSR